MSILNTILIKEDMNAAGYLLSGAAGGAGIGGIGGHLYGKFKTRKMSDSKEKKKIISAYRNGGLVAGLGTGLAIGGAMARNKMRADAATARSNNIAAYNKNAEEMFQQRKQEYQAAKAAAPKSKAERLLNSSLKLQHPDKSPQEIAQMAEDIKKNAPKSRGEAASRLFMTITK